MNNTAWIVLATIAFYFVLLFVISWITGRKADNAGFFTGNRKSPWYMVAIAMTGASISGVTFISVPGAVMDGGYSYMQMVLGFFVGSIVVALVLIPMFYRMNLVSIYGYLENRFGLASYRTGAWFFFVSKMLGASVRFFVVCVVLQTLVFEPLHMPFALNVILTVALIWLYSFQGGVKSLIWTDSLKTFCLVVSVVSCIVFIAQSMGFGIGELPAAVADHPTSKVFFFDDPNDGHYFWKQFIAGVFMVIATTGLDQDLMQRTMSCKNFRESQKNMIVSSFVQIFVIGLFLVLGTLLYMYAGSHGIAETKDALFGAVAWSDGFPIAIGILFIIGLIGGHKAVSVIARTRPNENLRIEIAEIRVEAREPVVLDGIVDVEGFAGTDLDEGGAEQVEAGLDGDFGVSDNIFGIDLCRPRARGSTRDAYRVMTVAISTGWISDPFFFWCQPVSNGRGAALRTGWLALLVRGGSPPRGATGCRASRPPRHPAGREENILFICLN